MSSALTFLFIWILALYLSYKFVLLNIKQTEKYPKRYFELNNKEEDI